MAKIKKKIKTIKIDADKCNGCRGCEIICSSFHATRNIRQQPGKIPHPGDY